MPGFEIIINVRDLRTGPRGRKTGKGGRYANPFDEFLAENRLHELAVYASHMQDSMQAVKDFLFAIEIEQFDTQGIFSGGWEENAVYTSDYKRENDYDLRVLHMTHALRESLTDEGAENQSLDVTNDEVLLGSTVWYAEFHDSGTRNMPQRKPIDITPAQRRDIKAIIKNGLLNG